MSEPVSFLTIEDLDDGIDLVVSFGIGPYAEKSLTLLRTPNYEALLPAEERGVSVGYGVGGGPEREVLVSLHWGAKDVRIASSRRQYVLNVQAIDSQDCVHAKKVLREMNFDARFQTSGIEPEPGPDGVAVSYDPNRAPVAQQWFDLAEADRIQLVERYHRQAKIKAAGMTAHCAIHAIVENQLAMKLDFVGAALERLMKQGLTRHDAVHAIGSQVAEMFVDVSRDHPGDDGQVTNARYKASIERLSAASWGRVAK
jgi:hypothetical protein